MASDKGNMLSKANYYAGIVSSASEACAAAVRALIASADDVSENWKGASGGAMVQALSDVQTEISQIRSQLASLESQMRAHAWSIYNSWPEETEDS